MFVVSIPPNNIYIYKHIVVFKQIKLSVLYNKYRSSDSQSHFDNNATKCDFFGFNRFVLIKLRSGMNNRWMVHFLKSTHLFCLAFKLWEIFDYINWITYVACVTCTLKNIHIYECKHTCQCMELTFTWVLSLCEI